MQVDMPKQTKRTFSLLTALLAREPIEDLADSIWMLPEHRISEDGYLDYKRGSFLTKPRRERAAEIRRMVSGFANAEGGVLLIGVAGDEETDEGTRWEVTGCDPRDVGARDADGLREWVESVVRDLAPHILPFPRVEVPVHPEKGPVVVIATHRTAANLVPCLESEGITYYLRIGSSTPPMPPYLHADLMLGRRQHVDVEVSGTFEVSTTDPSVFLLRLDLHVDNPGISWCPEGGLELVGYVDEANFPRPHQRYDEGLPLGIQQSVKVWPLHEMNHEAQVLTRFLGPRGDVNTFDKIPPLSRYSQQTGIKVMRIRQAPVEWRGALLVSPEGQRPVWVQLQARIDAERGRLIEQEVRKLPPDQAPEIFWGSVQEWLDHGGE